MVACLIAYIIEIVVRHAVTKCSDWRQCQIRPIVVVAVVVRVVVIDRSHASGLVVELIVGVEVPGVCLCS